MWQPKGVHLLTQSGKRIRHRGAQPGNRNAWKHGGRSELTVLQLRLTRARLKAVAQVALSHGLLGEDFRLRCRPLRPDQLALLWQCDPQLAALVDQRPTLPSYGVP